MKRIILFFVAAIPSAIVVPALYHWIFNGEALLIESISAARTTHVSPAEVQAYTADFIGKPFYGVDLRAIARAAQRHPFVRSAVVRRVPPHAIIIDVNERNAIARTIDNVLIDEEGMPFLKGASEDLPVITSKRKDADFKSAAQAIVAYGASQGVAGKMKRIEIDDDGCLHAYFENDLEAEVGSDKYVERWQKLDAILNHLRKDGLHPDYIYLGNYPNPQQVAVKLRTDNGSRGFD